MASTEKRSISTFGNMRNFNFGYVQIVDLIFYTSETWRVDKSRKFSSMCSTVETRCRFPILTRCSLYFNSADGGNVYTNCFSVIVLNVRDLCDTRSKL